MRLSIVQIEQHFGATKTSNEWLRGHIRSAQRVSGPVQRATPDLTWYHQHRECDMGIKAINWEPGTSTTDELAIEDPNQEERILRVIAKEKPIRRALVSLSWHHQQVLGAYFGHGQPFRPYAVFKDLATIVHMTHLASGLDEPLDIACRNTRVADTLRNAAERLLLAACEAYVAARHPGRALPELKVAA